MTEKQINKWLRKELRPIGWILIAYYAAMTLLVGLVSVVDTAKQMIQNMAAGDFLMNVDADALMSNAWGYILCGCLGIILLHAWKGPDYWRQEVFQKTGKMTPAVFFCAMVLCMGGQTVNSFWLTGLELLMNFFGKSLLETLETVSGSTDSFSMFLYGSVLAPVSEEILFRGYVLRSLRPYGKRFSIIGSALLFALFHGNILQGPYAFLIGLVLGWLTCEYSIHWAIVLHVFNNLVLAEGMGWLLEVLPLMAGEILNGILFMGALAISAVILWNNRESVAAYRQSEWIDRRCVKCLLTNSGFIVFALIMSISAIAWLVV